MKSRSDIRVLQLIDSLEPGGAERMAVTLANEFLDQVSFSGLVSTRMEGGLRSSIHQRVSYLFLEKKKSIDLSALLRLRNFVIANKIGIIHAHGSSYFLAVLLKLTKPSLRIFWHDHFGNRPDARKRFFVLRFFSVFFSGVFTVNETLRKWSRSHLCVGEIQFVPNFIASYKQELPYTTLKGEDSKRIVFLANLHSPKNHMFALTQFWNSKIANHGWTLHLIGKDKNDAYSYELKEFIQNNGLQEHVFIYGSKTDIDNILRQASAGILVSTYEGFPVTLLEYAKAFLPVICTDVGYCPIIIQHRRTGYLVSSKDDSALENAFIALETSPEENKVLAKNLNIFVNANYAAEKIIQKILQSYFNIK